MSIQSTTDKVADNARNLANNVLQSAQDLAARSIDFCADTGARARRQVQHAADATTRYVVQQPGKSVAIAAAAGAVVAAALLALSRRRNS